MTWNAESVSASRKVLVSLILKQTPATAETIVDLIDDIKKAKKNSGSDDDDDIFSNLFDDDDDVPQGFFTTVTSAYSGVHFSFYIAEVDLWA